MQNKLLLYEGSIHTEWLWFTNGTFLEHLMLLNVNFTMKNKPICQRCRSRICNRSAWTKLSHESTSKNKTNLMCKKQSNKWIKSIYTEIGVSAWYLVLQDALLMNTKTEIIQKHDVISSNLFFPSPCRKFLATLMTSESALSSRQRVNNAESIISNASWFPGNHRTIKMKILVFMLQVLNCNECILGIGL